MLLTEADVRKAARRTVDSLHKAAATILKEESGVARHFDIFLSHAIKDAEIVLGVARILNGTGKTVYVDWIVDTQLDRAEVTPETARKLRERMRQCDALFYLHSAQSNSSRWMPWELGYFDGLNGNVAIIPVVADSMAEKFGGSEYLGLYPYVDIAGVQGQNRTDVFVNRNSREHSVFDAWKQQSDKLRPTAT